MITIITPFSPFTDQVIARIITILQTFDISCYYIAICHGDWLEVYNVFAHVKSRPQYEYMRFWLQQIQGVELLTSTRAHIYHISTRTHACKPYTHIDQT